MELKKEEDEREDRSIKKIKKKEPIWNSTLHRIEFFGGPLIDLHHQFIKPKNIKYTINQPPFRRPKEKGDYLNKDKDVFGETKRYVAV